MTNAFPAGRSSDPAAEWMAVASAGEGAEGDAVEAVCEGDDIRPPGHLARQLQRGLDRVGAGRTGELQAVVHPARLQDQLLEALDEGGLGLGVHFEAVSDPAAQELVA